MFVQSSVVPNVLIALAAFAASFGTGDARAEGNRYALVALSNETDITIHYSFRWGKCCWKCYTLEPGGVRWHSWRYKCVDQNCSPVPHVRFDCDLSCGKYVKCYRVRAYAAPCQDVRHARVYEFDRTASGCHLGLYCSH